VCFKYFCGTTGNLVAVSPTIVVINNDANDGGAAAAAAAGTSQVSNVDSKHSYLGLVQKYGNYLILLGKLSIKGTEFYSQCYDWSQVLWPTALTNED